MNRSWMPLAVDRGAAVGASFDSVSTDVGDGTRSWVVWGRGVLQPPAAISSRRSQAIPLFRALFTVLSLPFSIQTFILYSSPGNSRSKAANTSSRAA